MLKFSKSFGNLKTLVIIRNIFLFSFKILISIFLILFIAIVSFIIILSIKPRVVPFINNYIIQEINNLNNIQIKFNTENARLYLDYNLGLQYEIKDFVLRTTDSKFKLSKLLLNIDFTSLLFGKIIINTITINDSVLEINLNKRKIESKKNNPQKPVQSLQDVLNKISKASFVINRFILKDFEAILFVNGKKSYINVIDSNIYINLRKNNLIINQETLFNINKNRINSKIKILCKNFKNKKHCKFNLYNINLNNFAPFFNPVSSAYDYSNNIKGYFNANLDFLLNNNLKIESGNLSVASPIGSFDLKQFFDEKINFTNLTIKSSFDNNFKIFNIDSINANFDKTKFNMSMFSKEEKDYKDIDLNFDIENIPLINLKQLWPNFLGKNEGIRDWVLEHIIGGTSPKAIASMNMKYFNSPNETNNSGLQTIYAEVQMDKAKLNYSDYFPIVDNINGLAVFTKNDMNVKINFGDVLNSKINNGNVYIDFIKPKKNIIINAETKGHFSDLFIHIDKTQQNIIENHVSSIIEDYYTNSKIKLKIPLYKNIDFYNTEIMINSKIINKINALLKNSSNILLSFTKPKNSNSFFGKFNLTASDIKYLPLNLYKPPKKELLFSYKYNLKDSFLYIEEFKSLVDYFKFSATGYIDMESKQNEIDIKNIEYNNSNYSVKAKTYLLDDTVYNDINIYGKNINYSNIIDKLKFLNFSNNNSNKKSSIRNEVNLKLNLQFLSFDDNNKIYNPNFTLNLKDDKINSLNFDASLKNNKYIKVELNKKNNIFNIKSDDFGLLFSTIELNNNLIGGNGEINIGSKKRKGKNIINGNIKIDKKFRIVPDENIKQDLLSDVDNDKNFKDLQKGLKKDKEISFDKLRGEFTYNKDILTLDDFVINSKYINFQILASGYINIRKDNMQINGLLVPLGIVNGLFGINKVPVVSDLIFGQKDAGLFASKFSVIKKDKDSKTNININKFSIILPGPLRNFLRTK